MDCSEPTGATQLQLYGLVASEQTTVPFTKMSTRLIGSVPGVAEALIVTVDFLLTVVPFAGLVIETCGCVKTFEDPEVE